MLVIKLTDALDRFLSYLRLRGCSHHTARAYRDACYRLLLFVQARHGRRAGTDSLTPLLLGDWQLEAGEEVCSPAHAGQQVSAVRSWVRFLQRHGHVEGNPAAGLRGPRLVRPLPVVLAVAEVERLLRVAAAGGGWQAARGHALVAFWWSTACRVSEAAGLDLADVRGAVALVRKGKGQKERYVPLGPPAVASLARWLGERERLLAGRSQAAVFLNSRGDRLTAHSMERLFARLVRDAGLDPRATPHSLRHSAASAMLANGCDLRVLAALLGHCSLGTVGRYCWTAPGPLQAVHKRAHPLA